MNEYACHTQGCTQPATELCRCKSTPVLLCIHHCASHQQQSGTHRISKIFRMLSSTEHRLVLQAQEYIAHCMRTAQSEAVNVIKTAGDPISSELARELEAALDRLPPLLQTDQPFCDQVLRSMETNSPINLIRQARLRSLDVLQSIYQESLAKYQALESWRVSGHNTLTHPNGIFTSYESTNSGLNKMIDLARTVFRNQESEITRWLADGIQSSFLKNQLDTLPQIERERRDALKVFEEANLLRSAGNLSEAIRLYLQCATAQRSCGVKRDLLDTLWCLGTAYEKVGNPLAATGAFFERFCAKLNNPHSNQFAVVADNPLIANDCVNPREAAWALANKQSALTPLIVYDILFEMLSANEVQLLEVDPQKYYTVLIKFAFAALKDEVFTFHPGDSFISSSSLIIPLLYSHTTDNNVRRFIHPSIVHFLVAKELAGELERRQGDPITSCSKFNAHPITENAEVHSLFASIAKPNILLYEQGLLEIVLESRIQTSLATAAANAITLLNKMNYQFAMKDFSQIRVPGANLSGADLTGTNLNGSDLQNVNLAGCKLVATRLKKARLTNIQFGLLPPYPAFPHWITATSVYPGECILASKALRKTATIWDGGKFRRVIGLRVHSDAVRAVSISSTGAKIVSGSKDRCVLLWDAVSGESLSSYYGHFSEVTAVNISADESLLVSGDADSKVIVWRADTRLSFWESQDPCYGVTSVCLSSDNGFIAIGGKDRSVALWNLANSQRIWRLQEHRGKVTALCFSTDAALLASTDNSKKVILWNTVTGHKVHCLQAYPRRDIITLAFSPSRTLVAIDMVGLPTIVWGTIQTLHSHALDISAVCFSTDCTRIATGGGDGRALVWDVSTGYPLQTFQAHTRSVIAVCFSRDDSLIASGSNDRKACVWRFGLEKPIYTLRDHSKGVSAVCFSPDGSYLVTGSQDLTVVLWNMLTGLKHARLKAHKTDITLLCFSQNGTRIISSSYDRQVVFWEIATSRHFSVNQDICSTINAIAVSSNDSLIAIGSNDCTVKFWDAETLEQVRTLNGHTSSVTAVSFSVTDVLLVSASTEKTVIIWRVATGQQLSKLRTHSNSIREVCFSAKGAVLVCGATNNAIEFSVYRKPIQ